ncbi:MAG: hypothetical protein DMG30_09515 [Acidobacteria bacterium]|nr:MAG: hypothetical protein DMG30_09515 [Acidobacteriota bacterium]
MDSLTLKAEREPVEYHSRTRGEFANSYPRDAAFEQLLRLAVSYASLQTAPAQGGSRVAVRRSPVAEDIELRAYHIYLARGATDGHDLNDWLQAERQVLEELMKNKASLRLALAFGLLKDSVER